MGAYKQLVGQLRTLCVLKKELDLALNFIAEKGNYHFTNALHADEVVALCFARKEMVNLLRNYGTLVQMDITHKLNKYDWNLLTIYFRDTHGVFTIVLGKTTSCPMLFILSYEKRQYPLLVFNVNNSTIDYLLY